MSNETRLILTSPPTNARDAASYGLPVGHMAYRVGPGARLLRANIPLNLRGGLMVVDSSSFDGRGDPGPLCQQVIRECASRSFDGVILDFEGDPHPVLGQIVAKLGPMLAQRNWPLYITEEYATFSEHARIIIPSALSGGSLAQRLEDAIKRFGNARVALGIQRSAEDFTLPAPTGSGTALSQEMLSQRIQSRNASVFFSDELCAYYFTYMSRHTGAHFVLFDNAASIRKKIQIARKLNLCACLLAWPEVADLLPQILE